MVEEEEGEKKREGEGSEKGSGVDGKSGDLLAGIKRVPACLKHGPSALIRDEDTSIPVLTRKSCIRVSYSQKSFTLSLSLFHSICLSFYITIWISWIAFYKLFHDALVPPISWMVGIIDGKFL